VKGSSSASRAITMLGSRLFKKNVSGARVVSLLETSEIAGFKFSSYGAHIDSYPVPYVVCSCTLGIKKKDIDLFVQRLYSAMNSKDK
jgi:O-phospho-L-seryl-tRNASec:L-selenocysteinyl-tRNA synthase